MYEVELKVRAAHEGLYQRLESMDANPEARVEQVDTYYDAPHRDFAETDEALRIRRERPLDPDASDDRADNGDDATLRHDDGDESDVTLTYKGPLVEDVSKTREERETGVADGDELAGILAELGFEPAATVEKERTFFDVGGYAVALDVVSGLGEFVEVEREAAEADVAPVREGAIDVLESLGLDPDDGIRTSYLGLLLESGEI